MTYPKTKKIMNEIVADLTQTHMLVHQHHWYMPVSYTHLTLPTKRT